MQKLFLWIGIFLIVSNISCALGKSAYKKPKKSPVEHVEPKKDEMADLEPTEPKREKMVESEHAEPAPPKKAKTTQQKKSSAHKGPHWSYEGKTGPEKWGRLNSEYKACASGKEQSPINLTRTKMNKIGNIRFHYNPTKLNILNNGHTIQVNTDRGSSIRIEEVWYNLVQFHFHTPSEHTIEGSHYPMELHLVHKDKKGRLAVVGVMMVVGRHNSALETLFSRLPPEEGKENMQEQIDMSALLPAGERTFRYPGSLTTPPCSEGVRWNVFLAPISISNEQLASFKDIFENNSRPVQPTRNRVVLEDTTP